MSEPHRLDHQGTALHYWMDGPATGPVVVLVHGATLDHHSFDAQVPALVAAGYRVVTPDLRGHGRSTPMGVPVTVRVLADDLGTLLDHLGAPAVALVGHSFGSYVVQDYTRRFPHRVHGLVLIASTTLAKRHAPIFRLLYRLFPPLLARMSLATFHQRTLADLSVSPAVKTYAAQAMQGISKPDFITIILAGLAALWLDSGFPPRAPIPVPWLLTHGAKDRANGGVFLRQSPRWARQEPLCQYAIIPAAGHTAHMDNPTAFNHVLLDFLAAHAGGAHSVR
ncbi:MAG TPA: alpha/beta hydrolase [Herpetosiphonaceae bacterium]